MRKIILILIGILLVTSLGYAQDIEGALEKADLLMEEKKYEEAIDAFKELIQNHPDSPQAEKAQLSLGLSYKEIKDYKNVIVELNTFIEQYPESKKIPRAHFTLARAYSEEGLEEKSFEHLKKSKFAPTMIIMLLVIDLLLPILFILGVLFLGKFIRKKKLGASKEESRHIFRVKHVILIAVAMTVLSFLISLLFSKLLLGQYLHALVLSTKAVKSLYVRFATRILSNSLLAGLVLWLVFKKYLLTKKEVGFIFRGWKDIILLPLVGFAFFFVFIGVYIYIVEGMPNINIQDRPAVTAVKSIETVGQYLIAFISLVIIAPITEEIIFRLFFYNAFKKYTNIKWGIILSALLFGIYHFSSTHLLPILFIGLVLAYVYERKKSILPCMAIHMFWNFLCFIVTYFSSRLLN